MVEDLALKVREVSDIAVDQPDRANTGRRQVERRGGTKAACPDDQDAGLGDLFLSLPADFGKQDMPAIAGDLFVGEFHLLVS